MDYEKLVERLLEEPKDSRKAVLSIYDLCVDAAEAIKTLLNTLNMAQRERDIVTKHMIELEQEVGRLRAERDAAVADISAITKGGKTWMCPYCKHGEVKAYGIADCDLPHGGCEMPFPMFVEMAPAASGGGQA